jgi:hypothetical protein
MNHNKLVVFWSKRERDFLIRFPRSCDGHLAHYVFAGERQRITYGEEREREGPVVWDPSFVQDLEKRGYDTTTLRFEVTRRAVENPVDPPAGAQCIGTPDQAPNSGASVQGEGGASVQTIL